MILYSTNSIKNADGESANLSVTGSNQDELKLTETQIKPKKISKIFE